MKSQDDGQRNRIIISVIIVIALVAAVMFILISMNPATSRTNFSGIPQSRLPDGGFVLGNPDAPVTIIEFADYGCPHCQEYKPTIDRFINDYVKTGKAKFELRIFPTAGGQTTVFYGNLADCFEQQRAGAFWDASELFFEKASRGDYGADTGRNIAQELGLDYAQALVCSQEATRVKTDVSLGQSLGVSGTPSVAYRVGDNTPYLGGERYEDLVAAVSTGGL